MGRLVKLSAALAACAALAPGASAQNSPGITEASAFFPLAEEPPPRLFVGRPLPGPLARGAVLLPYRVENVRLTPVVGQAALDVSPRVGHLHVSVDDLPWRWADASGDGTVVVNGFPPGPHKILIEIAAPDHRVLTGEAVTFTVPETAPRG